MLGFPGFLVLLLQVLQLVPATVPHPHHPHALVVRGAGGELVVTYQTVDFNAERLEGLATGFEWHLAFAALESAFPLRSGEVEVPAGRYKLGVVLGAHEEGQWSVLLEPYELWAARRAAARQRDEARRAVAEQVIESLERDLAERGVPTRIVLPTSGRDAPDAEHLHIEMVYRGFQTAKNGSTEATGGLALALRIDMGDQHRVVELTEVVAEKN